MQRPQGFSSRNSEMDSETPGQLVLVDRILIVSNTYVMLGHMIPLAQLLPSLHVTCNLQGNSNWAISIYKTYDEIFSCVLLKLDIGKVKTYP